MIYHLASLLIGKACAASPRVAHPCWRQTRPQCTIHLLVVLWIYSALMPKRFPFLKEIASFKLILFIFHRSETIPYLKLLLVCTLTMHLFCQGCCHYFQLSKELPCLYLFWTSWLKNIFLLCLWYGESLPLLQVIVLSHPCWLQFLNITKTLSNVATLNSWQETLQKYYL